MMPVIRTRLFSGIYTRLGSGIWRVVTTRWRVRWRNHDALYVAMGHWRLRINKPHWMVK